MGTVTLKDVAESAGVSVSTVSLALRDDSRIAAETRAVVSRTAERLSYSPRSRGRPTRGVDEPQATRRSNRIALLVPGMPRALINAPVYMDMLHGVEAAVAEQGKTLVLRHLLPDAPIPVSLFPQKVDGVVLFGLFADDEDLRDQLMRMPCVQTMGIPLHEAAWDHVTYDNSIIGELAASYLLERGHRTMAMLAPEASTSGRPRLDVTEGRHAGFRRVLESAGCTLHLLWDQPLLRLTPTHQEVVRETLDRIIEQLLSLKPRPTGIFCSCDQLTAALHPLLLARGVVPGRDLDIVSCNNEVILLQNLHPRPATVDIHAHAVGKRTVEQLLWRIEQPNAPRSVITLEPTLVTCSE